MQNRRALQLATLTAALGGGVAGWLVYSSRPDAAVLAMDRPAAPLRDAEVVHRARSGHSHGTTNVVSTIRSRIDAAAEVRTGRDWQQYFPGADGLLGKWHLVHPATVTVAPYPDLALEFSEMKATRDAEVTTWVGRNPDLPGATLVGVARPGGYDAVLLIPGASQFFFHVREGLVRVEESVASGADCGVGDLAMRADRPSGARTGYAEAGDAAMNALAVTEAMHSLAAPVNSDVLFLYNAHALAVAQERSPDPVGYIDGYARAALETCSQALVNSRIEEFTWRYMGLAAAPTYPAKTTVGEEVSVLAPNGPLYSYVQDIRRGYGADQVLMWLGTGERKGAAYTGGRGQPAPLEGAVAVLRLTAPVLVLAHELGHNFGCHHDRAHAGSGGGDQPQPDGDGFWCYGVLWNDSVSEGGTTSGTIMAYADWVVPYFSNPAITLEVSSTMQGRPGPARSLGSKTIGYSESDPRAANNARVLREGMAVITAHGSEAETAPLIWDHPQNATLVSGATLQLSVAASGRNLAYQWHRNGTAIAGANGAAYSRTFAPADAGDYTVTVTNPMGSTTSRTAAISAFSPSTLAVPATPAPSTNPTSSGGGGGSTSLVFVVMVAAALLWRRATDAE